MKRITRTNSALVVAAASLFFASCAEKQTANEPGQAAPASASPVYYVDGARPSPGAENSDNEEGCVQWSRERTDVWVCGPIPDGFSPAPPPGDASDYPQVCSVAAQMFAVQVKSLVAMYSLDATPRINGATCQAGGIGDASEGRWLAKFSLQTPVTASNGTVPFDSAEVHNFTLDGQHGEVDLSKTTP